MAGLHHFSEAEPLLLACAENLVGRRDANARQKQRALDAVVSLYEAWQAAEPDRGYSAKAAEWRAKLAEYQASTQPVTRPGADAPTRSGDSH